MVRLAVQGLPGKGTIFQKHIASLGACLRDGNGAGIQHENTLVFFPDRNMSMTVNENFPFFQGRERGSVEMMPVGQKERSFAQIDQSVIRKDREFQNHLIHFRITISANAKKAAACP